jgi:TonB family protein
LRRRRKAIDKAERHRLPYEALTPGFYSYGSCRSHTKGRHESRYYPFEVTMAVKREFGIERQPHELKERSSFRNPKTGKPENVDALVSRFLAELSDLSSEMNISGKSATETVSTAEAEDAGMSSLFGLREDSESFQAPDLDRISDEIEKSLIELETLRPAFSVPKEGPKTELEVTPPEPLPAHREEAPEQPVIQDSVVENEDQSWNRLELFRESIIRAKAEKHEPRNLRWILAGMVCVAVLGIAAYFFLKPESAVPKGKPGTVDAGTAKPARDTIDLPPAVSGPLTGAAESQNNSKPVSPAKDAGKENRIIKTVPQPSVRSTQREVNRNNGAAATTRPEEPANRGPSAMASNTGEEPSGQRSAQAAGAGTTPVQSSEPEPSALETSVPPNSNPVVPAGASDATSAGSLPAPSSANTREANPPSAKIALPSNSEKPDTEEPLKIRTAIQAEAIRKVPPVYPPLARAQRISGKVEVEAEISDSGDVFSAKAISGPNMLRAAAEEALRKWKFKPASVDGVNIRSKARITVTFNVQ